MAINSMTESTTFALTSFIPPFIRENTPDKIPSTLMSSNYQARNLANQSQSLIQAQLALQSQSQPQLQPPLPMSSVIMQNIGNGRGENSNTFPHQNNSVVSMIPSLVVSDSTNKPALPFQLPIQDVNGMSNLTHLNATNTNMGNIAPVVPMNRMHQPVNSVQNIMLSNAHVQTHLPPIGFLPQTPHHPVAEFLYQLTKMLTDDNSQVIEWTAGRICVHDPQKLADTVLHKYFRHSKYASFQRQLNYFGFRKIAGKGKMSPCSYVNDAATLDLRSLLFIKRKTSNSATKKNSEKNRDEAKRDEGTSTPSAESYAGNKRNAEDTSDQESAAKRQDVKQFPLLNCSSMNIANNPLTTAVTAKLDVHSSMPPSEAPLIEVNSQLQDQQIPSISQIPVQIIPRIQNFQPPSQAQQTLQYQNKGTIQDQNSQTVAEFPFNEQLHFPSEKSLAVLARSRNASLQVTSEGSRTPSNMSDTPSLLSSEDSFPATRAVNYLNTMNKELSFGSSLTQWQNKNREQPLHSLSDSSDLNSLKKMDGILPSWDALFPDSVNLQNAPSTSLKNEEEYSTTTEMVNMNSMLSRDSSLVDLAMLPTLSMLDMCRNTNQSDGGDSLLKINGITLCDYGQSVDKVGKSMIG